MLLPTGGFVFTTKDLRFNREFWSMADIQTRFSPYATGIYYSDKSNPLVANFTKTFLGAADNPDRLFSISQIYGINNLLYRENLVSTLKYPLTIPIANSQCQTANRQNEWSITTLCKINDPYPILYTSVNPELTSASISGFVAS